jgi:hypothetical protein
MTEPLLYSAQQAAEALGIAKATFNQMFREGRIPKVIQHPATFGQTRSRRYSRHLLELWAAGALDENAVNIGPLDLTSPARHLPAGGRAANPTFPPGSPTRGTSPSALTGEQGEARPHPRPAA